MLAFGRKNKRNCLAVLDREKLWREADLALRAAHRINILALENSRYLLDSALLQSRITESQWDAAMLSALKRYDDAMSEAISAYDAVADMIWTEERGNRPN